MSVSGHDDIVDLVLVATGRRPNTDGLGLEEHGVALDSDGFVKTDITMRTSAGDISAAGDVVGAPLLAHKAAHEALVAVDRLAGVETSVRHDLVPSVTYTSPEVASVGMTLDAARQQGCVEPGALGPVRGDRSSGRRPVRPKDSRSSSRAVHTIGSSEARSSDRTPAS